MAEAAALKEVLSREPEYPEVHYPQVVNTHHRRPRSIGGSNEGRNRSEVNQIRHSLWHDIFGSNHAQEIALVMNKYELFGQGVVIDLVPTSDEYDTYQKGGRGRLSKTWAAPTFQALFYGYTVEEIINEINSVWLDPDYRIVLKLKS